MPTPDAPLVNDCRIVALLRDIGLAVSVHPMRISGSTRHD